MASQMHGRKLKMLVAVAVAEAAAVILLSLLHLRWPIKYRIQS